jgi:hypothetical protein
MPGKIKSLLSSYKYIEVHNCTNEKSSKKTLKNCDGKQWLGV